jgi:hypothetical protein
MGGLGGDDGYGYRVERKGCLGERCTCGCKETMRHFVMRLIWDYNDRHMRYIQHLTNSKVQPFA